MNNSTEQEKILVRRLVRGDEDAFCELYATYKNRLMYFAMRMLKSTTFSEDVFQDTFSAVWKTREFIDPEAPFGPYVYTIMRNRIVNMLVDFDKNERLKESLLSSSLDYAENGEQTDIIVTRELMELLENALHTLTPQQHKVFRLSREQGLSHKEIAEELNISVNTVQRHISASLQILRKVLQKHGDIYIDMVLLLFCMNLPL